MARPNPFTLTLCLAAGCSFGLEEADPDEADTGTSDGSTDGPVPLPTPPAGDDALPDSSSGGTPPASSTGGESESNGDTDAGDSTSSSSSAADMTSSGGACSSTVDCDPEDICVDEACVDAATVPHALRVTSWDDPCDGIGEDRFYLQVNNNEESGLTKVFAACPQGWPDDWFVIAAGAPVTIDFYEVSQFGDVLITTWCWDEGLGCGLIPSELLHDGGAVVGWDGWTAEFEFTAVE